MILINRLTDEHKPQTDMTDGKTRQKTDRWTDSTDKRNTKRTWITNYIPSINFLLFSDTTRMHEIY